mgnify:CR=1 FL=1
MIDVVRSIYNFAEPPKKKKVPKTTERVLLSRARQDLILDFIRDKPLSVPAITKLTGHSYEVTRQDVRSLLARGKIKNYSEGATYFVGAI